MNEIFNKYKDLFLEIKNKEEKYKKNEITEYDFTVFLENNLKNLEEYNSFNVRNIYLIKEKITFLLNDIYFKNEFYIESFFLLNDLENDILLNEEINYINLFIIYNKKFEILEINSVSEINKIEYIQKILEKLSYFSELNNNYIDQPEESTIVLKLYLRGIFLLFDLETNLEKKFKYIEIYYKFYNDNIDYIYFDKNLKIFLNFMEMEIFRMKEKLIEFKNNNSFFDTFEIEDSLLYLNKHEKLFKDASPFEKREFKINKINLLNMLLFVYIKNNQREKFIIIIDDLFDLTLDFLNNDGEIDFIIIETLRHLFSIHYTNKNIINYSYIKELKNKLVDLENNELISKEYEQIINNFKSLKN